MKLLLMFILFFSCPSTNTTTVEQDQMSVAVGDTFLIRIPSSIATGFTWQLKDSSNNYTILLNKKYEDGKKDMDGEPGEDVFTFKAQQRGSTVLNFVYIRLWEKGLAPKDERKYKVVIK
jgi:predicted secreted protein